jgi:hypothetical protein
MPDYSGMKSTVLLTVFFISVEWLGRENKYAIENLKNRFNMFSRWSFYIFIIALIALNKGENQQFIYFQF